MASPVIFYSLAMQMYKHPLSEVPEPRKMGYLLTVGSILLLYLVSLYFVWERANKTTLKLPEEEFEDILFSDIRNLSLERLMTLVTNDNVIVIETNNSKKIRFFVADGLNSKNSETQEVFNLISRQVNFKSDTAGH